MIFYFKLFFFKYTRWTPYWALSSSSCIGPAAPWLWPWLWALEPKMCVTDELTSCRKSCNSKYMIHISSGLSPSPSLITWYKTQSLTVVTSTHKEACIILSVLGNRWTHDNRRDPHRLKCPNYPLHYYILGAPPPRTCSRLVSRNH